MSDFLKYLAMLFPEFVALAAELYARNVPHDEAARNIRSRREEYQGDNNVLDAEANAKFGR